MNTAAEYVAAAWEAVGPHAAAQNVLLTCETAVALALVDARAEKYRILLAHAIQGGAPLAPAVS